MSKDTTDPRVKATVYLGGCTGMIANETLVLTAAHCISGTPTVTFSWDLRSGGGKKMRAKSFKKNPSWGKKGHEGDIAYIVLPEKIPSGYAPLPVLTSNKVLTPKKSMVTLMGYGQTSDNGGTPGHLRAVDIVFKGMAPGYKGMIMVGPAKNKGACFGDSGGPAFYTDTKTGQHYNFGVTSGADESLFPELNGATGCSTGAAIYTEIIAFKDWIEKDSGEKLLTASGSKSPSGSSEKPKPDNGSDKGDNDSDDGNESGDSTEKEKVTNC